MTYNINDNYLEKEIFEIDKEISIFKKIKIL